MKQKIIPMRTRYAINTALILLLIVSTTLLMSGDLIDNYYKKIAMLVGINIILAVSLNVATGYLGQLPLGHAGFMAVGAYTVGIFMKNVSGDGPFTFAIALVLAAITAGIVGIIVGIPALRLRGDYLAIITLGFGEIIRVILLNIDSLLGFELTGGASNLKGIPRETTFLSVLLCVVIICYVIHTVMKSRHGRAVLSIRDNEIAAEACGIPTTYYKTMAFVLSAACTGVAGGLYAGYIGILVPNTFGFVKSIEILVMVVLGGMGSMLGSIISAIVLTVIPEMLRSFESYRMVVYSLLLIVVMVFKPSGLMGTYDFSLSLLLEKFLNRKNKPKQPTDEGKTNQGGTES